MSVLNQILCKLLVGGTRIRTADREVKPISRVFVILSKDKLLSLAGALATKGLVILCKDQIILSIQCWPLLLTGHT